MAFATVALSATAAPVNGTSVDPLQQARQLRRSGHPNQAIEIVQTILRQTPKDVDASMELVWDFIQSGRIDDAQRTLDPIRAQHPALVDASLAQALLLRKRGNDQQAEAEYKSILARDPENISAITGLADIYSKQQSIQKAKALYAQALDKDPNNYELLMGMGRLAAQERNWRQAHDYYIKAQAAEPASSEPQTALKALLPDERWWLSSWYSLSTLSGNRSNWQEFAVDLLYQSTPNTWVGGTITNRHRFDQTDTLYSVRLSHIPRRNLELHGELTLTPSANFSPNEIYTGGVQWRVSPPLSLLFDYKRLQYSFGNLDIYAPGATWWFNDRNYLTGRYSYGRAYGNTSFHNYSVLLNLGLPKDRTLRLTASHGSDPEFTPGVENSLLTPVDAYSCYLLWPVAQHTQLSLGVEHEDLKGIYSRDTFTAGFITRF